MTETNELPLTAAVFNNEAIQRTLGVPRLVTKELTWADMLEWRSHLGGFGHYGTVAAAVKAGWFTEPAGLTVADIDNWPPFVVPMIANGWLGDMLKAVRLAAQVPASESNCYSTGAVFEIAGNVFVVGELTQRAMNRYWDNVKAASIEENFRYSDTVIRAAITAGWFDGDDLEADTVGDLHPSVALFLANSINRHIVAITEIPKN